MSATSMDLEVFVVTHNRAHLLEQTLTSLCNQTARGFRIVVLDNGSTDNTPEVAKNFEPRGVELFRSENNTGHLGNFNRAKALASREWVMVFHDDDIMHPAYIELAMELINKRRNVVLVGSGMTFEENPNNDIWQNLGTETIHCKKVTDFATLLYGGFPLHFGSVIYRTELFKFIPIEWETYGKIFDRPFLLDIAKHGEILVLKEPFIKYRCHAGQDSIDSMTGPFPPQLKALHRKYRHIMGSNPLTSSGRVFLYMYYIGIPLQNLWLNIRYFLDNK